MFLKAARVSCLVSHSVLAASLSIMLWIRPAPSASVTDMTVLPMHIAPDYSNAKHEHIMGLHDFRI